MRGQVERSACFWHPPVFRLFALGLGFPSEALWSTCTGWSIASTTRRGEARTPPRLVDNVSFISSLGQCTTARQSGTLQFLRTGLTVASAMVLASIGLWPWPWHWPWQIEHPSV